MRRASLWIWFAVNLTLPGVLILSTACSSQPEENEGPPVEEGPTTTEPPANPEGFPDVVATVNGADIYKTDLLKLVESIEARAQGAIDTSSIGFYRQIVDDLVSAELLYQASQEQDLAAEEDAVDRRLDELRGRFPDPSVFEQTLAAERLTVEELRTQIQRDLSIQNFIDRKLAARVEVTEGDKRQFYDDNAEQMQQPERLRLSHILKRVPADASAEDKEAARLALEKILEQARSGADFSTLAREHSEDPGSAANGGELVVARGQTVPAFEQAAFALEPGGLSPIVETPFGFHIIKLSERMPGELMPYEQVEGRIEEALKQQGLQAEVQAAVESLREKARVEVLI